MAPPVAVSVVALFCCIIVNVVGLKYGSPSSTLHVKPVSDEDLLGPGMRRIVKETGPEKEPMRRRFVRDVRSEDAALANISSVFAMNDSHHMMMLHWAGEGSDVIIALTKNANQASNSSTSELFISTDYGRHFEKTQDAKMKLADGSAPILSMFYHSSVYNSHYVFTDTVHKCIFTTRDYGRTFNRHSLIFTPDLIVMHPHSVRIMLGHDTSDPSKRLYVSRDFGVSWTVMEENVKSFSWDKVDAYSGTYNTNLYVERRESSNSSTVLKSSDLFVHSTVVIRDVQDFQIQGEYMLASKKVRNRNNEETLELWVSHGRRAFQKAQFENDTIHKDYYVADASEDQVFLCINHNATTTHLYISSVAGVRFTLSLTNIVYFNPKSTSGPIPSRFASKPFADIHKVEGLRGMYIASQLKNNGTSTFQQVSMITFNKGGRWRYLTAPSRDSAGHDIRCSHFRMHPVCTLHLGQNFHSYWNQGVPILTKKSAVGLIIGSGNVGSTISSTGLNVYISRDAGYVWHEVLKGRHFYAFGDHGGLIVAVQQKVLVGELMYSYDEGASWTMHTFSATKMSVYGILTEPGEHTTVFTIFGSLPSNHSWVVIYVNLKPIFRNVQCTARNYKNWSPADNAHVDCLMGRKVTYQRKIADALCYNGRSYQRPVSVQNCSCKIEDYECDFGYKKTPNSCVRNSSVVIPSPAFCPEGTYYLRSKGYRRVAGDTCHGGDASMYDPERIPCRISEAMEFLLYISGSTIHRYLFGSRSDQVLPLADVHDAISVEYDYHKNCVYWGDSSESVIRRQCLNGSRASETVMSEPSGVTGSIEGLALDWMSETLYWVNANKRTIEVVKTNGHHRRVLINNTATSPHTLERPRSIVVVPKFGRMFWTDWAATNPRIMTAWMDGTHIRTVVNRHRRVIWPNGIAVDEIVQRIYWTDGFLHSISYSDFDGRNYDVLFSSDIVMPHPYAIAIYKGSVYFTDWIRKAVLMTSKFRPHRVFNLISNVSRVMDLKIMTRSSQQGTSLCDVTTNCSSLCLERPFTDTDPLPLKHTCLCSDSFPIQGADGQNCSCYPGETVHPQTGLCVASNSTCNNMQFLCVTKQLCIPTHWHCDGDDDCGDMSDETNCPDRSCRPSQFICMTGKCIPQHWQCDGDNDCGDGSDESGCGTMRPLCLASEFSCTNGRCIHASWKCDGDDDCHDGSDEANCSRSSTGPMSSTTPTHCSGFRCPNGACIAHSWVCDGGNDCGDNSDEAHCPHNVSTTCSPWLFRCSNGVCITRQWLCDGDRDCIHGEDEDGCTTTRPWTTPRWTTTPTGGSCSPSQYSCLNGRCVYMRDRCDRVNDCGDWSDERDCAHECRYNEYMCSNNTCIPSYQRCDGIRQCANGDDEYLCPQHVTTVRVGPTSCLPNEFRCNNGHCIYMSWVCDGTKECADGEDELHCTTGSVCGSNQFRCMFSEGCIALSRVCDGHADCVDHTDERNCHQGTTPNWGCTPSQFNCSDYECIDRGRMCDGVTDCANGNDEKNCSIDVTPGPPRDVTVVVTEDNQYLRVTWNAPGGNPGRVRKYVIYFVDLSTKAQYEQHKVIQIPYSSSAGGQAQLGELIAGHKYRVWMTVWNLRESDASNTTTIQFGSKVPCMKFQRLSKDGDPLPYIKTTASEVTVYWEDATAASAALYVLTVASRHTLEYKTKRVQAKKGVTHYSAIVGGLSQSVIYDVFVKREATGDGGKLTGPCMGNVHTAETKGDSIPALAFLHIDQYGDATTLNVSWIAPKNVSVTKYTLYYDYVDEHTVVSAYKLPMYTKDTTNTSILLTGLNACEDYFFYIQVIAPWRSRLSTRASAHTGTSKKAPPKNVRVIAKPVKGKSTANMTVTWDAPCDLVITPLSYIVRVEEAKNGYVMGFGVASTKKAYGITTDSPLGSMTRGATYHVSVTFDTEASFYSKVVAITVAPYPAPVDFKVIDLRNASYFLTWDAPKNMPVPVSTIHYEIYHSTDMVDDHDVAENFTRLAVTTDLKYVTPAMYLGTDHTFKVCYAQKTGYPSAFSPLVTMLTPKPGVSVSTGSSHLGSKTLAAIVVPCILVVGVLFGLLAMFVVRHVRLQNRLRSFADSHYDTRLGTATFTSGDDLEEEQPMIQGFSDDEPLVIA